MFNNVALDVVIGLVFIFLLYSLLASIVQEIIATKLSFRSKILEKAILRMLEDSKGSHSWFFAWINGFAKLLFRSDNLKDKRFASAFFTHPLLKYLAEDNWFSKPDYISSKNFSKVIIDLLHGIDTDLGGTNVLQIKKSIETGKLNLQLSGSDKQNWANENYIKQRDQNSDQVDINPETRMFLQSLFSESKGDITKFKALLESWFDDTMQRATGWYKRYIQYTLVIIGFVMAYSFNVDTIAIAKILAKDDKARDQIVEMAVSNHEKYGGIVSDKKLLADTLTNDSLLTSTYRLIQQDADKATKILGLGRPWKDSCKMCKDSAEVIRLLLKECREGRLSPAELSYHKSEMNRLERDLTKLSMDSSKLSQHDSLLKVHAIDSLRKMKNYHDTLVMVQGKLSNEYQGLITFSERCRYIEKATAHKWNKYSDNQEGGWETFFGWVITALAISLGAPFWFDLLSKLIKVRTSGGISKDTGTQATATTSAPAPVQPIIVNTGTNPDEEAVG